MYEEEADEMLECAECGAVLPEGAVGTFAFGDGAVLCFECAVRRGGEYDAEEDHWLVTPNLEGFEGEFAEA